MKNRKCPSHKACLDYDNGNCENCVFGETIIKLHKRIDRLKKQNETLTIQRNAWFLAAKAVKEETALQMQVRFENEFSKLDDYYNEDSYEAMVFSSTVLELIDRVTKEIIGEENAE